MSAPAVFVQQPVVVAQARPSPANNASWISATRGLGITQIVLGCLTVLFGILTVALLRYWAGHVGFGIWGGIWIIIGGVLGVSSASNTSNTCLNGTNMAFAIVSCVVSFIQFIVYCFAAAYYNSGYACGYYRYHYSECYHAHRSTGVALYVCFLLIMLGEFCVALTAAIYCCKNGCCGAQVNTGAVIVQGQPQQAMVFQSSGMTTMTYPMSSGMPVSYATPVAYPTQPQMGHYPQGPFMATAGYNQGPNPTAMTYEPSKEGSAPPPYSS